MSKVKTISIDIIGDNHIRLILLRIIIGGIVIVGTVYAYFILSITFNILARRSLESTIQTSKSNIAQLELTYFSDLDKINKNYALANGFVNARNNIFATRSTNYVAIR